MLLVVFVMMTLALFALGLWMWRRCRRAEAERDEWRGRFEEAAARGQEQTEALERAKPALREETRRVLGSVLDEWEGDGETNPHRRCARCSTRACAGILRDPMGGIRCHRA